MRAIGDPHLALPDQVQLAHEPAFVIGSLTVTPVTRQVARGSEHETLEPHVMQVLVALAHAPDRILTRDELVERCWGGRIVGEDAINRVLSRLRQVAAGIGGGSFAVETIRGVGYRLVENGEPRLAAASSGGVSRRTLVAGSAVALAAAGGAAWLLTRPERQPLPLAMQYYQRGLATRGQASLQQSEQGAALFREATRIDPRFAQAWGALAWSYRGLLEFAPSRPDSAQLRALSRSAAARALELDPDNVEAQAALLLLNPFYRNWLGIERGLRELLERHPRNSILEFNLGFVLCEAGRFRASLPYSESVAQRRDQPASPRNRAGDRLRGPDRSSAGRRFLRGAAGGAGRGRKHDRRQRLLPSGACSQRDSPRLSGNGIGNARGLLLRTGEMGGRPRRAAANRLPVRPLGHGLAAPPRVREPHYRNRARGLLALNGNAAGLPQRRLTREKSAIPRPNIGLASSLIRSGRAIPCPAATQPLRIWEKSDDPLNVHRARAAGRGRARNSSQR